MAGISKTRKYGILFAILCFAAVIFALGSLNIKAAEITEPEITEAEITEIADNEIEFGESGDESVSDVNITLITGVKTGTIDVYWDASGCNAEGLEITLSNNSSFTSIAKKPCIFAAVRSGISTISQGKPFKIAGIISCF